MLIKKFISSLWIFRILVLLEILSCYYFLNYTRGLIYLGKFNELKPVTDLKSSGDEDNFAIGVLMIFYIILFFLLMLRWNQKRLFYLMMVFTFFFFFSIYLIQGGEIINTIFKDGNISLFFVVIIPFLILGLSFYRKKAIKMGNK